MKKLKAPVTLYAHWMVLCLALLGGRQALADLPEFTKLVRDNAPAVVNISTVQKRDESRLEAYGLRIPEILRDRFRMPEQRDNSLGSGFIISSDGYVLTNYHVVRNAAEIIVRLSDRRELIAELIGADKASDLALLKVDGEDLPTVKIGRSEKLEVGEWVVAIGSPFGFEHSVTQGIVSAKGRSLPSENYVPFIQTDVAINPGNSGGPLFNLEGEVVGINSQIFSGTGGYIGLSFAIPVDVAMEVVDQLKSDGKVTRGWLGVVIQEVDRDLAESFGLSRPEGALVADIMKDSPAAIAGLQQGDVIVSFEGKAIRLASDLPHLVGRKRVGAEASLDIFRDGKKQRKRVIIKALPDDPSAAISATREPKPTVNQLGIVTQPLSGEDLEELELDQGIQVVEIRGDVARDAGLRNGDVITKLNSNDVKSVSDFHNAIEGLKPGEWARLLIVRRGMSTFIAMRVPPE